LKTDSSIERLICRFFFVEILIYIYGKILDIRQKTQDFERKTENKNNYYFKPNLSAMKKHLIIVSIILFFLVSCGSKSEQNFSPGNEPEYSEKTAVGDGSEKNDYSPPPIQDKITATETTEETVVEKKIIKTADIKFGVSDYKKTKSKIESIVKKYKGFISQENESNNSYSIGNSITIRVPFQNFDSIVNALEGEADKFESKSINLNDVTEEFIDIEKRLENKRKVEAQYLEILKKAYTIHDILEVNEHIRVIREEIEAKEGRLKYLSNQVGLSTVTLYIHQDFDTVSYGFFHKIGEALSGGWNGFLGFIVGLIYVWPLILIGFIIFLLVRRGIRKRRENKVNN
jgi:hypothetical protein